ncbi:MAG TPA: tRNA 2-thiouridine(34) synthase MnmA [bacterium]|nr:tRNA 2-thiouridine(34) synthase MnmA [bacterium]
MDRGNKTVAVAMSGGVDSSVAAALLQRAGYQVVGLTMHLWDYPGVGGNVFSETSCCSVETANDARSVCENLGIAHYVIDVREEFETAVIDNFAAEYLSGRTPNPCILCNSEIKWKILLQKGRELGADFFSTGHYAQVVWDENSRRFQLLRGKDRSKDQVYALWRLTQDQLKRTILPLGGLTKTEVRTIAAELDLKTKDKQESQEICFIPDDDYSRFLSDRFPEIKHRLINGKILDQQGTIVGEHRGYPFYTIGQRKGLGVALGKPVYVTNIDATTNTVVVGENEALRAKGLVASQVNWISIEKFDTPLKVVAKIRYNDSGRTAMIFPETTEQVRVLFEEYHSAITPGQSVVFFQDEIVVGGGVIEKAIF